MVAYEALKQKRIADPFVIERATTRDCLNLAKSLRVPKTPKLFYVYESK